MTNDLALTKDITLSSDRFGRCVREWQLFSCCAMQVQPLRFVAAVCDVVKFNAIARCRQLNVIPTIRPMSVNSSFAYYDAVQLFILYQ